jgi:hypothetical protein
MRRLLGWEDRLRAHFVSVAEKPFEWGTSDCLCFAGGALEAVTGEDLWAEFRGKYLDRMGMARLLRRHGYEDIRQAADAVLPARGMRRVSDDEAFPGDIAVVPGMPGQSLAVRGDVGYVVRWEGGIALVEVEAMAVWSVPI